MRKAFINEDIQILVAWDFVKLKKGTEIIFIRDNGNKTFYIELKKGKYKGRRISIDPEVIALK
ncbi:hypothetical protein [Peribacillus frigoritolerans]|uniref:hypothetical protein n=1 Tax=Peribacillus frigoritolerans TaxID=450367 RepID=UPI001F4F616B|nr:hypothetical protein [Peribacillus frigoritolerans]MCK2020506.1 hypothetical protein [Peribacillus frigoritolerans]